MLDPFEDPALQALNHPRALGRHRGLSLKVNSHTVPRVVYKQVELTGHIATGPVLVAKHNQLGELFKQARDKFEEHRNYKENGIDPIYQVYSNNKTAAQILQRFVNKVPWAHLDIAGVAWQDAEQKQLTPSWGTGWGVRILNRLVTDNYET